MTQHKSTWLERSSRSATISKALCELSRRKSSGSCIVEIGTLRSDRDEYLKGDGCGTLCFAEYAKQHQARFVTVDVSEEAVHVSRELTKDYAPHVEHVCEDGRSFLSRLDQQVDLLYLDGPFRDDTPDYREVHTEFFHACRKRPTLVLIDDVFSATDLGKGANLVPELERSNYRCLALEGKQALYIHSADSPTAGTMYIAANNCLERGYFLGDMLTMIKSAWLFVQNEPHEHIVLSLHDHDPLSFLWDRFVRENCVTVVYDRWAKADQDLQYSTLEGRLASRSVKGIRFDTYKELYPRLDGGARQHRLCGSEKGLGRPNIFGYYYFGQQTYHDDPSQLLTFGPGVIDIPKGIKLTDRTIFVSPHEKCQGNRVFTLQWWEAVVLELIKQDVSVIVNDDRGFMAVHEGPHLRRSFLPFRELVQQVAAQRLVVSGNSGVGWLAAAIGTPFLACERDDMVFSEYSFKKCGCQSLVSVVDEPNVDRMVNSILAAIDRSVAPT